MDILALVLLVGMGTLVCLLLLVLAGVAYYHMGKHTLRTLRQVFLRPGTAQVTGYEIFTPDLTQSDASDARPMIRLQLDCERQGQRFPLELGPLTCGELFLALDQSEYRVASWMTDEDWRQLLENRQIIVACDPRRRDAALTSQVHAARKTLVTFLIALASLTLMALLQI